jgi:hypothetical protein
MDTAVKIRKIGSSFVSPVSAFGTKFLSTDPSDQDFLKTLDFKIQGETAMKMREIRMLAKNRGINSFGQTKENLIRQIQRAEGNFDCFGSAAGYCDQSACAFRSLCLDPTGKKTGKDIK